MMNFLPWQTQSRCTTTIENESANIQEQESKIDKQGHLSDIYHDSEKAGDDFECMADKEIELKATIKSLEEEIFTSKTTWRSC